MKIKILPFGQIAEIVAVGELDVSAVDVKGIRKELIEKYPALSERPFLISLNQEISNGNPAVNEGDEIALLPPYAGG
jgi:sulfur-carrier protein